MAALIAGGQRHVYVLPPVAAWGDDRPSAHSSPPAGSRREEGFTMSLSQFVALTARVDADLDPEVTARPSNQ
jgi:hypothetical protein